MPPLAAVFAALRRLPETSPHPSCDKQKFLATVVEALLV